MAVNLAPERQPGVFVTDARDFDVPARTIMDLTRQKAGDILATFNERRTHYATAPFDPHGDRIRFYKGGVTIWSGYPGAGKTTILRQLCCHLLHQGRRVFFASLEEDPEDLLVRLAGVAFGTDEPSEKQLQNFLDFYAEPLRIWGVIGIANHKKILGVIQNLAGELILPKSGGGYITLPGVSHAIVDSLMCLDISNDDFEAQRKFANLVASTARTSGCHIHLVAHPRKVVSSDQEPDINDVAGAREIGGIADNVIFVRRGGVASGECTPMKVAVRKQRYHTGACEDINGWLNRRLKQFKVDQFDGNPTQYLPASMYPIPAYSPLP